MSRRIAHLSDLHFGRIDPHTLDPLARAIEELKPDLIAVSGDLTQRARRSEFEQAREFLKRLPGPRIVVPGNHDVPLRNPYMRFVSKWDRFREYIHGELGQSFNDDELAVIGINTARAMTWKGGRISLSQIEAVRHFFASAPERALKVLIAHHPLDIPADWARSNRALRSGQALQRWAECGVDLILAGHAHRAFAGHAHRALAELPAAKLHLGNHDAIVVQAGTATSTRGRGEPNSFNVIYVNADEISIARQTWLDCRFQSTHQDRFARNQ